MKSILAAFLLIGLLIPITVNAGLDYSRSSGDESEIQKVRQNADNLLSEVKGMLPPNDEALAFDIQDAIKVYVDVDLFDGDSLTENQVEEKIAGKESIWLVPIYTESKTYWVTIAKGLPVSPEAREILTQEEIEQLESKVGQWTVSEIVEADGRYSYTDAIKEVLSEKKIKDGRIYIFGGTNGYRDLLVAVCQGEKTEFLPLRNVMDSVTGENPEEQDSQTLFSFSEMKEVAEAHRLQEGQVGGGAGIKASEDKAIRYGGLVYVTIAGIIVGIISAVLLRRRYSREN